ncbi:MAG: PAS domain S-box protein [Deltaproteobacteria bacterium]|nr:PAS domain S-box protein [Deltaproteobacteria bacterium]
MKRGHITELEKQIGDLKAEKRRILDSLRTARTELEACRLRLQHREELYHAVPSILVVIQDGRITDVNNSVAELLGYDPDELLGKPFLEIVNPEDRPQVREIHARRLARKVVPAQYEAVLLTREGHSLPCEVRVRKMLLRGKRAFVVSLTPMDKRREREENRLRSKKTEAVLTMASALAVRFGRHCSDLQSRIERLGKAALGAESPMGPELQALETIMCDALRTTEQLKTIARERMEPTEARLFDLKDVVKEAVSLGQGALEDRDSRDPSPYRVKTYLRSGARILGNPDALRDVIAHLVRNALEAMPGGGDLYVTSEESGGQAHLTIMDNGRGVPEQLMDRIFAPFFTTREGEAAGLGLSVAYAVIRRHGGRIEVTSEMEQGTEIRVRLPVASLEAEPGAARADRTRRPGKVLVIAATRVLRELLDRFFSAHGWRVVTASGVREGVGRLQRETYGGIILESLGGGGRDEALCRSIKNRYGDIPTVLISDNGGPDGQEEREGRSAFDLVVRKPLLLDAFAARVRRLFSTASHAGKKAVERP